MASSSSTPTPPSPPTLPRPPTQPPRQPPKRSSSTGLDNCSVTIERRGDEWSGMAVHLSARIGAMAGPEDFLASRAVRDLSAGSSLVFEDLGHYRFNDFLEDTNIFRVKIAG